MELWKNIKEKSILVVGDIILDQYMVGITNRISPEAPVPVFLKKKTTARLGGAANVAVNLVVNRQKVSILSIIGNDSHGKTLLRLLESYNIDTGLLLKTERPTSTKTRLVAGNNQQVLRVDEEVSNEISEETETQLINILKRSIDKFDVLLISDYMKGVLTYSFTKKIIEIANSRNIKVLIDAKDAKAIKYRNSYLIKPNQKELEILSGLPAKTVEQIAEASKYVLNKCKCEYVLTTCGADGMILVDKSEKIEQLRTTVQEVYDVTGAGDTVIAYLALCVASGFSMKDAMIISNFAAGIQVSKLGTSSVYLDEVDYAIKKGTKGQAYSGKLIEMEFLSALRQQNLHKKIVFTNGCFDIVHAGHVRYLNEASKLGDILVVGLNSDASVKRLKGMHRPVNTQMDRVEVLSGLDAVDYIVIFEEDTPYKTILQCQPDILVKGGDYTTDKVVGKDLVESRGGRIVLIPFVEGKSTTDLIARVQS